ncbi:hypothetical protein ACWGH2_36285 [Streptomyces sp. NPDC054871]
MATASEPPRLEDPRLSDLYTSQAIHGGGTRRIRTASGVAETRGFLSDGLGLVQASCQGGDVTFLIRTQEASRTRDVRTLLPDYVAAEADRIGYGPLRIELPD